MNKKVLTTLEFDKITKKLSEHATSDPGRSMCESLVPYEFLSDAKRAADETEAATDRIIKKGSISFGSNRDISSKLKSLKIGAGLDMASLIQMASFLENVSRVKKYGAVKNDADEPLSDVLSDYFDALEPLSDISGEIRRCILSEDEMSTEASAELKSIRRNEAAATEKIREVLNRLVNGAARSYLQDAVITMRGDRYCLPVKAEHKNHISGIVHDRSSSGSTLFIEPASVVELNNKLKELMLLEIKEIERILALISGMLSEHITELKENSTYMTLLDFIFAKASYGLEIRGTKPLFSEKKGFNLIKARHPLIDRDKAVPIDVRLREAAFEDEETFKMLVITGPNTGGKTVTLKTAGLLTVMGESGLMIPALEGSKLGFYKEIYADIGDEQSIEQSLSTFSAHMTSISDILKKASADDLCIFDELGAGTDPTEGAALAIAILIDLLNRDISVMATTHYAELKVFAMSTEGVKNASCEFDVDSLRPTYRLLIGTPGSSNAFAISKKLGIPERIIEGANSQIGGDKKRLESLFRDLENARKNLEISELEISKLKKETNDLNERLKKQSMEMEELGEDIMEEARAKADEILSDAKSFADDTIRIMRRAGAGEELLREIERQRTKLNEKISGVRKDKNKDKNAASPKKEVKAEELKIGTMVKIVSMGLKGSVISLPAKNSKSDKINIQCGVMQVNASIKDLEIISEDKNTGAALEKRFSMKKAFKDALSVSPVKKTSDMHFDAGVSHEINLIGMNSDDAIAELDKYLDDAMRAGLSEVRVVHGKGSGILRSAVANYLKGLKYVKSFKAGEYGEGDAGVTVVTFR